jgi:ABC-type iron transport system FetAB ATPase subunit
MIRIAISGPEHAGKSTIAEAIARLLLDPDFNFKVSGVKLEDKHPDHFRDALPDVVVVVEQDSGPAEASPR